MALHQRYYYHGTAVEINGLCLVPKPSHVVEYERVVFAARYKWMAIAFAAPWGDDQIAFGTVDDQYTMREQYSGAFNALRTSGFVYTVSSNSFHDDERLGLYGDEFISRLPVHVLSAEYVKCIYTELASTAELTMLSFETPSPWQ